MRFDNDEYDDPLSEPAGFYDEYDDNYHDPLSPTVGFAVRISPPRTPIISLVNTDDSDDF